MNILFVFDEPIIPSRGGVQRVTELLAYELNARGHSIYYLSYRLPNLVSSESFTFPQTHIDIYNQSGEIVKIELENYIKCNGIDCVINQLIKPDLIQYLPRNIKIVSVCHVQPFCYDNISRTRIWKTNAQNIKQRIFKIASLFVPQLQEWFHNYGVADEYRRVTNISNKVCFISDKFYARVLKHVPDIDQSKLYAINNPNTFDVVDDTLDKENIILYVGRVENGQKNTIDFIRTWNLLYKNNIDWKAIVVGDGSDLEYNMQYVHRHSIERIDFVGQQSNVSKYYRKAKIVAVTSYGESWCMAVTEGMANACIPFVYDTYETIRDIIDDKTNGYIVKPNPRSMAAAIQQLINNPILSDQISKAAKEKVNNFNIVDTVDKWESLLTSI